MFHFVEHTKEQFDEGGLGVMPFVLEGQGVITTYCTVVFGIYPCDQGLHFLIDGTLLFKNTGAFHSLFTSPAIVNIVLDNLKHQLNNIQINATEHVLTLGYFLQQLKGHLVPFFHGKPYIPHAVVQLSVLHHA